MWEKVKLLKMSNFTFFHNVFYAIYILKSFKGGYLDFSRLTELKNTHITEIYMKKKNKTIQIINNQES